MSLRLNGRTYKELFKSQARKAEVSGEKNMCNDSHDVNVRSVEGSCSGSKRHGVDLTLEDQDCLYHELRGASLPVVRRELESGISPEHMDKYTRDMHCTISQPDAESQHEECVICKRRGKLFCCDGQGCKRNFHLSCVNPPLTCELPGVWYCIWCIKKEIEYGVHSVSEGIESILDSREVVSEDEVMQRQKQYFVKYKGLAHVHNLWISEGKLVREAPLLLARFNKHAMKTKWRTDWSVPHRLLHKRLLLFPPDDHFQGHAGNELDCNYVWLVKWTGLNYDRATWELENMSFLKTPEATKLIRDFESRHQKSKTTLHPSKETKGNLGCPELTEFPFGGSCGISNRHLTYVNKLREYWYRCRNAVVFDGQERIVKVVLFILSLLGDTGRPFLIIASLSALSLWEAEFSCWASSTNIVVYKGNRDVRDIIRTLEFYNEDGCMMFEVLLSTPDVADEDLKILELIQWEAIIIDECQRPGIFSHLKQIKMLAADMRLILITCQINDRRFSYHTVLSLVDPEFDGIEVRALETSNNLDNCKLKDRLSQYVAYKCKSGPSAISEYWVPIHLSNVQIEQYCASLLSNTMLLCSNSKSDTVGSLQDILILSRKCCNHPYLVDQSLQSSVTSGLPVVDNLDVEINVSGKLQLLEKVLLEIRKRGLRVLILFQALGGSGQISTGDILDDFVHQRFGKDSYARIDGEIVPSKKLAAVNMFNNKENGNFVFLIDNRACLPSIKLSSVDTVILFDSDWNPINDLKSLQKIIINSQQLKVFRLYSPCTVEEKMLMLAKQGVILDSNIQTTKRSTCHVLLSWGASYLLSKLDDFHGFQTSASNTCRSSAKSLLDDVLSELSALLPNNGVNGDPTSCSIVLNVNQEDGGYPRNTPLRGEMECQSMEIFSTDNGPPHVFWSNLLKGRCHLSEKSQRSRRKSQLIYDSLEESEMDGDESVIQKRRKAGDNTIFISPTRRLRSKRVHAVVKKRKLADLHNSNRESGNSSTPQVANDFSLECEGRDAVTLIEHVTEVRQHSRAATPVSGEMPSQASSSTMQPHVLGAQRNFTQSHQVQVPRQPSIEDSTRYSNSSNVQPMTHMHVEESETDVSNLRSNQSLRTFPTTSEMLQSDCLDSLQMEMERIQKDKGQAIKLHEDMKLKLKSECDREMAEIRKKYDVLLMETEMTFEQKKKDLETRYNKVGMNKLLAEAFVKKHDSTEVTALEEPQQETISSLRNQVFLQTAAMATLTLDGQMTSSPLMTNPAVTPSESTCHQTVASTTPGLNRPVFTPVQLGSRSAVDNQRVLLSAPSGVCRPVLTPVQLGRSSAVGNQRLLLSAPTGVGRTVQLGSHSAVASTTALNAPSIPMGTVLRAPAPHLRSAGPSPRVLAPNLIPPNPMLNSQSRVESSIWNQSVEFSRQEAEEGTLSSIVSCQLLKRRS